MKVLLITSNSFSETRNNGKTLKMMFSEFNKSDLCQFYCRGNGDVDFSAADSFYYVSDMMALKKIFLPWKKSGYIVEQGEQQHGMAYTQGPKIKRTMLTQFFREIVWMMSHWDDDAFWKWIEDNKPDVCFFMGSYSMFLHRIVRKIYRKKNIPVVAYFTDDYIIYPRDTIYKFFLIRQYKKTIAISSLCYAIGDDMAREYSHYFNKSFKAIMNIVPFQSWVENQKKNPVVLSYFGSLYYNRSEAIMRFAEILNNIIRQSLTVNYIIRVFTATHLSSKEIRYFKELGIELKGFVSGQQMKTAQQETDIFLHVESDNENYRNLTKLCVSTKVPEYLISSRPTIAFGPKDVASMKIFGLIDERMVIDSRNVDTETNSIIQKISSIINDVNTRNAIAKKCYNYACSHYLREIVAVKFKESIVNLIN